MIKLVTLDNIQEFKGLQGIYGIINIASHSPNFIGKTYVGQASLKKRKNGNRGIYNKVF